MNINEILKMMGKNHRQTIVCKGVIRPKLKIEHVGHLIMVVNLFIGTTLMPKILT